MQTCSTGDVIVCVFLDCEREATVQRPAPVDVPHVFYIIYSGVLLIICLCTFELERSGLVVRTFDSQ